MAKTKNIAIFGANGAIGSALALALSQSSNHHVFTLSRHKINSHTATTNHFTLQDDNDESLADAANWLKQKGPLDWVIVCSGLLHDQSTKPEKTFKDISREALEKYFSVNSIYPILIAKHLLPCLNKESPSIFAALSARVGSIEDNRLGGWYGYRASKAALNMLLKTASIELKRKNPSAAVIGIHPGTVDSNLSKPFQANVPAEKLFSPEQSAKAIIDVLHDIDDSKSGKIWAWDGHEIQP